MCITTVPVIFGERAIGASWQREQFAANTRSPEGTVADAMTCLLPFVAALLQ
jgi:hypothetical protein